VVVIAAVEEAFYRARVRHLGIAVADGRSKESDKMAAGAFAVRADNRRQAFETGAYGHGRLYDVISKSRPLCSLPGLKGCQRLCAPIAPLEALCGFIPMALGTAPARRYKSRFPPSLLADCSYRRRLRFTFCP
jgi:hypothetical protein